LTSTDIHPHVQVSFTAGLVKSAIHPSDHTLLPIMDNYLQATHAYIQTEQTKLELTQQFNPPLKPINYIWHGLHGFRWSRLFITKFDIDQRLADYIESQRAATNVNQANTSHMVTLPFCWDPQAKLNRAELQFPTLPNIIFASASGLPAGLDPAELQRLFQEECNRRQLDFTILSATQDTLRITNVDIGLMKPPGGGIPVALERARVVTIVWSLDPNSSSCVKTRIIGVIE
jgi:hypothetical protein